MPSKCQSHKQIYIKNNAMKKYNTRKRQEFYCIENLTDLTKQHFLNIQCWRSMPRGRNDTQLYELILTKLCASCTSAQQSVKEKGFYVQCGGCMASTTCHQPPVAVSRARSRCCYLSWLFSSTSRCRVHTIWSLCQELNLGPRPNQYPRCLLYTSNFQNHISFP